MISILEFVGNAWLLLGICMILAGVVPLLLWLATVVCKRVVARRRSGAAEPIGEPAAELPKCRVPIDPDSWPAREAQLDAVLAQCARGDAWSSWYLGARLLPYEAELSFLLEGGLELDDNLPTTGGDDAHA